MWLGIFSNFSVWVAVINCNEKEVHPRTQTFIYVIREKSIGNWLANIHIVNDTAVVSQQKVKDIVSSCWLQHLSS